MVHFNGDGTVTITAGRYYDLLENEKWMNAMSAAGVDNWDGMSHAADVYKELSEVK